MTQEPTTSAEQTGALTPATTPEILNVESINGLAVETYNKIIGSFRPFAEQFLELESKIETIKVDDVSQVDLMADARKTRLFIAKLRTSADKTRKELKADATQYNKAVQEIYNKFEERVLKAEEYLEKQEKFKELKEAEERAQKIGVRMDRLKNFPNVTSEMVINLSDEMFETFAKSLEAEAKQKELQEAEERAIAAEKAAIEKLTKERQNELLMSGAWVHLSEESKAVNFGELSEQEWKDFVSVVESVKATYEAEQEKIRIENERLKKEAEEREQKLIEIARTRTIRNSQLSQCGYTYPGEIMDLSDVVFLDLLAEKTAEYNKKEEERIALEKAAQEKAEADRISLQKEKEERERLEAELAQKQREEEERKAEEARLEKARIEAEKKAAQAPEKDKILAAINGLSMPELELKDESMASAYADIYNKFNGFKSWAQNLVVDK